MMNIKYPLYLFLFIFLGLTKLPAQTNRPTNKKEVLIFSDDFTKPLDTTLWIREIAPLPNSNVYTENGQLILDTKGGVTVWLNKILKGNIRIEYNRKVLMGNGKNDRLSDLNCFWMASDPRNKNLFTRNGIFESYDSLQLYYVGMGGNSNSTTRFRKYLGNGEKPLVKEYKVAPYLLQPNKDYHITITVIDKHTSFAVNGETYFSYDDPSILKQGYFGFRSTKSRQAIDDIKIYQLP